MQCISECLVNRDLISLGNHIEQFYKQPTFQATFAPTFAGEKQNNGCNCRWKNRKKRKKKKFIFDYLSLFRWRKYIIALFFATKLSYLEKFLFFFLLIRNMVNSKYLSLKDKKKVCLPFLLLDDDGKKKNQRKNGTESWLLRRKVATIILCKSLL